jgi:diguanylate cyclase (GGDEF)-like protein
MEGSAIRLKTMLTLLSNGLVIAGAGILVGSLVSVYRLLAQLPVGKLRRQWLLLRNLTAFFIAGYLGYLVVFRTRYPAWPDLIVPGVFFFGACFVWLTFRLALQTAVDIRRVTLLEKESITDSLTGLYNRRYLDRRLEEEFSRAKRYRTPLSILLVDIDHFKSVNDTHGHQAGDLVLSYLAKLTLNAVRTSDIAARYGGEELLVIAPNTVEAAAGSLAERLRQHIENHELVLTRDPGNRQIVRISVSVGVAVVDGEMENAQQLVQQADEALYRAKKEGRNRVVVHRAVSRRLHGTEG